MKNMKKLLGMLVAVCMIACLVAPMALAAGTGAQDDPIVLEVGVTQQVTVPASGTVYVQIDATNSAIELSVNGNRTYWNFEIQASSWWLETPGPSGMALMRLDAGEVYTLAINNLDETGEAVLDVLAAPPAVGTMENPDVLKDGKNVAVVEADSWGYFYNFTAEVTGMLTVTMGNGNWSYNLNNITAGIY